MDFLYAVKTDDLADLGLDPVIRRPYTCRGSADGPAGQCTVLSSGDGKLTRYAPADQVWTPSINGDYWVGYYQDDRPIAKELERSEMLDGHFVTLDDGGKWLIPVVRCIDGGCGLPASVSLHKDGQVLTKPLSKYSGLCAAAGALFDDFMAELKKTGEPPKLDTAGRIKLAIDCLAWNYHVSADEINALEILTTQNLSKIFLAILDMPSLESKKKLPGDGDLTAGGGD